MAILIENARQANRDGIELTTMQDNDWGFHVYQRRVSEYLVDEENGMTVIEGAMFLPLKERD